MSKMRDADMPLTERIEAAIERITHGQAAMRVPVEATDPDVVLADCQTEIERLRAGLRAVSDLIDESHGVAGLHRNGDVAPWSDLRTGGKYEEWLVAFDDALKEQR